jgi:hypothetical protein
VPSRGHGLILLVNYLRLEFIYLFKLDLIFAFVKDILGAVFLD